MENDKCLCPSYTKYDESGKNCSAATGICTPPPNQFIGANEVITLKLKAKSLNFKKGNLIVVLEYPSIPTAVTDIAVFSKNGTLISSFRDYLLGSSLGRWYYRSDASGVACNQNAKWIVSWDALSQLVETNKAGEFKFDIVSTTQVVREKKHLQIRTTEVASSTLIDVVPVSITFNDQVSTKHFHSRVEMILDYDVKLKYHLKKIHLDPKTLKMRAVLEHQISFPLSLKSDHLIVSLNGEVLKSRSYEKINKRDCPAKKGTQCHAKTILLFELPFKPNCTEYQLSIDFDLQTQCKGPNDHTSKYLCYGLKKSLKNQSVHVNLPIKYR